MAKKSINKKAKRRIFLFFIFFGVIIGSLSYTFFSNVQKILKIQDDKKELESKLVDLEKEEEGLQSDILKLTDPDYIAKYAREKYLYSKDGELIIRITDNNS